MPDPELHLSGQCADPEIVRENFNKIMRFLRRFVVTCVPVEIQFGSEEATPDGIIGVPYNYAIQLIGTQPHEINNIVAPSWMTVSLEEDIISFLGTPDVLATDLEISFFVTNCTGDQINFGAFIDVLATAPGGGGSDTYTGIAGEDLGGGKLVYLSAGKFYLYDANDTALADAAFGITKGAAVTDAPVDIQISGVFTEVGLGLNPDAEYYAGLTGLLTDTPTFAVCTFIGIALNSDSLKIEIQQSIITA